MPKFYAKIIAPVRTGRIYTEAGSKYFEIWYDDDGTSTTHYGDPEEYIKKLKARANKLHKPVIIER